MTTSARPAAGLPPTDQVARVLIKRGARAHALAFLRAATTRDPNDRAAVALLRALEARPDAPVSGPELALDEVLISAFVARGYFGEALALLGGTKLDAVPAWRERAQALQELIAPPANGSESSLVEAHRLLSVGEAARAQVVLDARIGAQPTPPPAVVRKAALLRAALGESPGVTATGIVPGPGELPGGLGSEIAPHLASRNLEAALESARRFAVRMPSDVEAPRVVVALERLVKGLEATARESPADAGLRTMPMSPQHVADLHIRMGNMVEAERLYRALFDSNPADVRTRERLVDVQALCRVLGIAHDPIEATETGVKTTPRGATGGSDSDHPTQVFEEGRKSAPPPTGTMPEETTRARARAPTVPRVRSNSYAQAPTPAAGVPGFDKAAKNNSPRARARTAPESLLRKHRLRDSIADGEYKTPAYKPLTEWDDDEESTDVLSPEKEAEILLKQGFADRALEMYEVLARQFPNHPKYKKRIEELRAQLEDGTKPIPGESTVKREMSHLLHEARPTDMRIDPASLIPSSLPPAPPSMPPWQKAEETTLITSTTPMPGTARLPQISPGSPRLPSTSSLTGETTVLVRRIIPVR